MIARQSGGQPLTRVIFTESHDADANGGERVPEATLAAAAVFTAPGVPMLFQGQEFLENLWFADTRPVDWTKQTTYAGILGLYRDLIGLRRNRSGVTRGLRGGGVAVHHVNDADKVLAYHRWGAGGPGDDTIVLLNFAKRGYDSYTIGVPRGGTWRVRFNSDWSGYDPAFGGHPASDCAAAEQPYDGLAWSASFGIGPYTALVLSQDN